MAAAPQLPSAPIRVLLVEDDDALRESLAKALSREGITITGSFPDAGLALHGADWRGSDILFTDLELPGLGGVELIRWARQAYPHLIAAVHTVHDDRELVFRAIEAGALGYVLKGSGPEEIAEQLRGLMAGRAPVSPGIAMMLLRSLGPKEQAEPAAEQLSEREIQLLRLLAQGHRYKEAAATLSISPHTVHTHVKRIYAKLEARGKHDAVRLARLRGIV